MNNCITKMMADTMVTANKPCASLVPRFISFMMFSNIFISSTQHVPGEPGEQMQLLSAC
jgi:hypothetical protein